MTAKILTARDTGPGYHIVIWLDTTKTLPDGATPNPTYVGTWDYARWDGANPATLAGYRAQIVAEVKLLAADMLARLSVAAGTALAAEGTTF